MSNQWRHYVIYYLTYIAGHRQAPFLERLSYLCGLPQFADAEYQEALADMAID